MVLPRLLICLLKDNFSDFEGLKVMVPVREECFRLLSVLQEIQPKTGDFGLKTLIQSLPAIFLAVEHEDWNSKLNFFLILKGLVLADS